MNIEDRIKRIEKALIQYSPRDFKTEFCDHNWEEINLPQLSENSTVVNPLCLDKIIIRCSKCGLLKDSINHY